MRTIFVEYKVSEKFRKKYEGWVERRLLSQRNVSLLEGTDQPGLFVEIWKGIEDFQRFKEMRKSGEESEWSELHQYIEGGSAQINIWEFKEHMKK